ncbi:MAG: hypothetical protein NTW21_24350 [Verrucomicrobia bacterium]|nr:hypothetical protein [Verrucomicrobiota bacterium]
MPSEHDCGDDCGDWYACNIGGDFPVVDCSAAGVVAEPLSAESSAGKVHLKGRFGVFAPGMVVAEFADAQGRQEQAADPPFKVSPLKPFVLDSAVKAPANATSVRLVLIGNHGKAVGELAKAGLRKTQAATRWPADKACRWHAKQPWLVGCYFLPSTAVNDGEMWQAESFDAATIEREPGWVQDLYFNTVRVFSPFCRQRRDLLHLLFKTATDTLLESFRARLNLPDGRLAAVAAGHPF